MSKAREFIDFWIENSIHAVEQYHTRGASQDVSDLTARIIEGAQAEGISEADMKSEIGDLGAYIKLKLNAANKTEHDRLGPN